VLACFRRAAREKCEARYLSLSAGLIDEAVIILPMRDQLSQRLGHYFISTIFVWLVLVIYTNSPYYQRLIDPGIRKFLVILAITYSFYGLGAYLMAPDKRFKQFRGVIASRAVWRYLMQAGRYLNRFTTKPNYKAPRFTESERVTLLFLVVKFIFLPLMLVFAVSSYHAISNLLDSSAAGQLEPYSVTGFNNLVFPMAMSILLLVDTAIFAFGYAFEASWLRNRVRSVEPTALGWLVALVCYPPLNGTLASIVGTTGDDYAGFSQSTATLILHAVVLLFMGIYVLASVALGPKASNLTNRGIVSRGPYRWVRHPAYTAKNLGWWLAILPVFSIGAVLAMAVWSFIYFLRAITEERHLIRDPDYQAYCREVRYRFIPGLV
jgi:protein-S-isoprenylcysteine O-methyltransferase Ste14